VPQLNFDNINGVGNHIERVLHIRGDVNQKDVNDTMQLIYTHETPYHIQPHETERKRERDEKGVSQPLVLHIIQHLSKLKKK
jgi:hypothetical protein